MDDSKQLIELLPEALNAGPVKNLLSPVTREIGEALGDLGSVFRFYLHHNLGKIFTKWAESGRTLSHKDFEKVMPLLLTAATTSDDDLQCRWAALLESAVAEREGFLPSFGRTLSEMTLEEARFLDRLWKSLSNPNHNTSEYRVGRQPLSYGALLAYFDSRINPGVNEAEWRVFNHAMTEEQKANYQGLVQAELMIQDLERLGILMHEPVADNDESLALLGPFASLSSKTRLRNQYSLTEYGVSFIRCVSP